ncbi:MAG: hypothetical protein RLZZ468_1688 [Cyanobacteriota bacterium]
MQIFATRDEDGAGMVTARCNDGSIWLDTGNATAPWRRLPAIPEATAEELEALVPASKVECVGYFANLALVPQQEVA